MTDPMTTPVVSRPPSAARSASALNLVLGLAVLVAVAGVAFAVGRQTAPAAATTAIGQNGQGPGQFRSFDPTASGGPGRVGPGGLGGGITVNGTVESIADGTLTITTVDGQSVMVTLDDATTYHQASAAAVDDVSAGDTVVVRVTGGFRPDAGASPVATDVTIER